MPHYLNNIMSELKEQIKFKAFQTFLKYGFRSVTMDDLCKELTMSKKTLYQFFSNKEELLTECIASFQARNQEQSDAIQKEASNPIELIFLVFRHFMKEAQQNNHQKYLDLKKYYFDIWENANTCNEHYVINKILDNLQEGKKAGLYREDLNEKIIAKLFYQKTLLLSDQDFFPINEFRPVEVIHELVVYHLNGICTDKGRKLINDYIIKYFNN